MLSDIQFEDIKRNLEKGEEITIFCTSPQRLVEIEKRTYDFSGKLRIKQVEVKSGDSSI